MVRIFLDLEMNMISLKNTEVKPLLPHEIIEIGAVKMDEHCCVTDRFRMLVRPRYNKSVHWTVQKLTGITAAQLRQADYLEEVFPRFLDWIGTDESVHLYAWSDSDRAQIEKECTYKALWDERSRAAFAHWTDFQQVFSRLVGYRNVLALDKAVAYMGLDFDGTKHDALSDAENCARLMALVSDAQEFARRKAGVPPEPVPVKRVKKPAADKAPTESDAPTDGESAAAEDDGAPDAERPALPKRRRRPHRHRRKKALHELQGTAPQADTTPSV